MAACVTKYNDITHAPELHPAKYHFPPSHSTGLVSPQSLRNVVNATVGAQIKKVPPITTIVFDKEDVIALNKHEIPQKHIPNYSRMLLSHLFVFYSFPLCALRVFKKKSPNAFLLH